MIGTGTPSFAARRTTAPCNASTSIRLPACKSMSRDEVAGLMNKLRGEKIVNLAESAP